MRDLKIKRTFLLLITFLILTHFLTSEIYAYDIRTWILEDKTVFGAKPGPLGPLGGGEGYTRTVTVGDYTVATIWELQEVLKKATKGDVIFIPGDVTLDFTALIYAEDYTTEVPPGVTLASDRGVNGSKGALLRSLSFRTPALITAQGQYVRITGLRLEGPDKEQRLDHYDRSFSGLTPEERRNRVGHQYYYRFPNSRGILTEYDNLEVDNCELWGWSHTAVLLRNGEGNHIHHNYIHHNQRHGLGYGITHSKAFSVIEYNLFNFNRHSIAGTGAPPSGYEARHNVEMGESSSHAFDMHGGRNRKDGTSIAGTRIVIENNTFFTPARAIGIRGVPLEYAHITKNWFYHSEMGNNIMKDWPPAETVKVWDNKFNSKEYDPTIRN